MLILRSFKEKILNLPIVKKYGWHIFYTCVVLFILTLFIGWQYSSVLSSVTPALFNLYRKRKELQSAIEIIEDKLSEKEKIINETVKKELVKIIKQEKKDGKIDLSMDNSSLSSELDRIAEDFIRTNKLP